MIDLLELMARLAASIQFQEIHLIHNHGMLPLNAEDRLAPVYAQLPQSWGERRRGLHWRSARGAPVKVRVRPRHAALCAAWLVEVA